ncbi:MAG: phosphotransferase family protein [Actinomycetota bacterium]|nr:phosphotransferase family protein [Actinomycetota bacterium]
MTGPFGVSGAPGADRSPAQPARPASGGGDPSPAGIDRARVSAWLTEHLRGVEPPYDFELIAGGRSNLTYAVTDRSGRRLVLRRPPTGLLLPTAHDMGREHRILSALLPAGIPVPRTLGYCDDPAVTGAAFYVMEHVEGLVLRAEGEAAAALDPAARRRASESLVDTLVAIHAVDPDRVGLGSLGRPDGYLARQLRRWYAQYRANRDEHGGPDVAAIDAVHDHLAAHLPEQGPVGIVHGDYRLDNAVLAADGSLAAVLDWELCTIGDVLADVGQLLVYWADPGEEPVIAHSATTDGGFLSRAEVGERYAAVSGRCLEQIDFYVAFASWKLACILEGVLVRYVGGAMGHDGFDHEAYPEMIRQLAGRAADAASRIG